MPWRRIRGSASEATLLSRSLKERIRRALPRSLRNHRILRGPLAGRRIYTSWHDYPGAILGTTERPLLDWFSGHVRPGETWLDVGAHYGYTAIALANLVGPTGRVFAFEPVTATAGCVARTRDLNRLPHLEVVPLALGARGGLEVRHLRSVRGMADSTIRGGEGVETIFVTRFDDLWSELCSGLDAVHGIKIDVQGMEGEVLRGMIAVLRQWQPHLVVEFHAGVDRHEILQLLADCGYSTEPAPIDPARSSGIADDTSYAFVPLDSPCASLSTRSSIARS